MESASEAGLLSGRYARLFDERVPSTDYQETRSPAQQDYDRLIHAPELRRLAGVTQVINPGEGHLFHNRLTHTLKVAQIARRIAQRLLHVDAALADRLGGLDPDVVESAALIHDLGHPPFGHVGERTLSRRVWLAGALDAYEGNAQSFRIVATLAVRRTSGPGSVQPGLNLSRATLNAILKYPWRRTQIDLAPHGTAFNEPEGPENEKWGVYHTEKAAFEFARAEEPQPQGRRRSLEAEVMDWADDIAYAVHDLEDFYRAGLIPIPDLMRSGWFREFLERENFSREAIEETEHDLGFTSVPYRGTRFHKALATLQSSSLIKKFVGAINLNPAACDDPEAPRVQVSPLAQAQVGILKRVTRYFVIDSPSLASQQAGQQRVLEGLFDYYFEASDVRYFRKRFPEEYQLWLLEQRRDHEKELGLGWVRARVVADKISSMTEEEALRLFQRISGADPGSVFDRT